MVDIVLNNDPLHKDGLDVVNKLTVRQVEILEGYYSSWGNIYHFLYNAALKKNQKEMKDYKYQFLTSWYNQLINSEKEDTYDKYL